MTTNNCKNKNCGCKDAGLTTPAPCSCDQVTCPPPAECSETFDAKCVYYTGEDLDCLGVETNDTLEDVIQTIATALEPFLCLECTSLAVPANASTNIPLNQTLTWNAVPGAIAYDVYLGTNSTNLTLVSLGQILTSYTPAVPLLEDTVYYWQVIPKNNAGVPSGTCPVYTFTTFKFECANPLSYFIPEQPTPPGENSCFVFCEALVRTLNKGIIQPVTDAVCCPPCGTYILASQVAYSNYSSFIIQSGGTLPNCCSNFYGSVQVYLSFLEGSGGFGNVTPCDNNFSDCIVNLKSRLEQPCCDTFEDKGVIEIGTIGPDPSISLLCLILNRIESLTPEQACVCLNSILDAGIIIECRDGQFIMASIETYLIYYEGLQPPPPPPL